MTWHLPLIAALSLILVTPISGCRQGAADRHDDAAKQGDHGHGKAAPAEVPSRAITVFTERTELFAEHRLLVAGHETPFAAHVTDLADFSAVSSGSLEAVLHAPDGRNEVFRVEGVMRPGIFRPVVKPSRAGTYQLGFRLAAPGLSDQIAAGEVTVYPDEQTALAAPGDEEGSPDEIPFLKEQQWKIAFGTRVAGTGTIADGLSLQGTVRPAAGREVSVSAPADGLVVPGHGRLPRLGDRVRKGEILAVLTPSGGHGRDRAGLAAALAEAEATHRLARAELARAERLARAGAGPVKRVAEARTALEIARSAEEAARHEYRAATAARAGTAAVTEDSFSLRAPIAGTVVEGKVVPGSYVAEGALFYRIIDLAEVWVEARVPEADVARVSTARTAEITLPGATPGPGALRGRLVTIGGVLDAQTRTAAAVYAVPNPRTLLRIGMSARVRALVGRTPPSPLLPRSAVVDDNGRPIAYVQTGGESFERRELKLGASQGDTVQVLEGIRKGERVVIRGAYEIRLSTLANAIPAHGHAH